LSSRPKAIICKGQGIFGFLGATPANQDPARTFLMQMEPASRSRHFSHRHLRLAEGQPQ
jgi:hypothetical protein